MLLKKGKIKIFEQIRKVFLDVSALSPKPKNKQGRTYFDLDLWLDRRLLERNLVNDEFCCPYDGIYEAIDSTNIDLRERYINANRTIAITKLHTGNTPLEVNVVLPEKSADGVILTVLQPINSNLDVTVEPAYVFGGNGELSLISAGMDIGRTRGRYARFMFANGAWHLLDHREFSL